MAKKKRSSDYGPMSCCFLCSFAVLASVGSIYFDDLHSLALKLEDPKPPKAQAAPPAPATPPPTGLPKPLANAYALKFTQVPRDVPVMPVARLSSPSTVPTTTPAAMHTVTAVMQPPRVAVKRPESAPSRPTEEKCPMIAFLRIQKTASTTFGENVMKEMCWRHGQRCQHSWDRCAFTKGKCALELFQYHLEYTQARMSADRGKSRGCVVTFLRDPVERTMSEYFMLREKHRQFLSFDQWDVHQSDLAELDAILSLKNLSESFSKYLYFPRNPSRNRQTLYLLGFERVQCNKTRCGGNACVCANQSGGYPAMAYDWDKDGPSLLQKAKDNLNSLEAFGITDCFAESIKHMAPRLGWNLSKAVELSERQERHVWKPTMEKAKTIQRRLSFTGPGRNWWREFLPQEMQQEVRKVNQLDEELLKFAKTHFEYIYGTSCRESP